MTAVVPDLEAVSNITRMVWSSVVGEDESLFEAETAPNGVRVCGIVHISGGWDGSVQLSVSQTAALRATAALFGMGEDEVSPAEITDAVGELTNMVGGSLKSILPGPSKLSLPSVTTGQDFAQSVPGARPVTEMSMAWAGEPLNVTVWAL
jgi:chemotaxis protein CheX